MTIESYSYGLMSIDGKTYDKDLIIFPDRILPNWWRKEGHTLNIEDLGDVLRAKPKMLIIGKGSSGFMKVPLLTKLRLQEEDIEVIEKNTARAVEFFNEQVQLGRNVAAAFHLTC